MTLEERVAALEAKTQDIARGSFHDDATGVDIPYLALSCRLGIFTTYWSRQPIGQGAALSIGTNSDRFALYAEIDEQTCPDHPSVAVYASVVPASRFNQPHIALQGMAGNAPDRNGLSQNYGLALTLGDRSLFLQREGLRLVGDFAVFFMGKVGSVIKQLWP